MSSDQEPQAGDYARALAEPRLMMAIVQSSGFAGDEQDARRIARDLMASTVEEGGVVAKIRSGQLVLTFNILPPATLLTPVEPDPA